MKLAYPAIFSKCNEGGYSVSFPDLPGCFTQGDNLAEAIYMAEDAASGWILVTMEQGEKIPKASDVGGIRYGKDAFINMILVDPNMYKRCEKKAKHVHLSAIISIIIGGLIGIFIAIDRGKKA